MKKIIAAILALFCLSLFLPAAFAADTDAWWFKPTLRVGVAFDAQRPLYNFTTKTAPLSGINSTDLNLTSTARPYFALELPFAVTDRLTIALDGDWSFTGAERELNEGINEGTSKRVLDSDGMSHWVSASLLVSYALVKDYNLIKDLSIVAGIRWDYQTMSFDDARDNFTLVSSPLDTIDFTMQTLTPVAGLSCTLAGIKSGLWGGDIHLGVLAGPVVWGHEDYRETFGNEALMTYEGDISHGYIVKALADVTVLSGQLAPCLDGSVSIFAQLTKTHVEGVVDGAFDSNVLIGTGTAPFDFTGDSAVFVVGIGASLAFDICGRPTPPAPPAAPVVPEPAPTLTPMSKN
jgi:hypothetical protein